MRKHTPKSVSVQVRGAAWWTNFRKALNSGGGTNEQGYVGIFSREAHHKPGAVYLFGEREVRI